jgi:hypothetical protein
MEPSRAPHLVSPSSEDAGSRDWPTSTSTGQRALLTMHLTATSVD